MTAFQHIGSTLVGFVTTAQVVETTTDLPKSKSELVALASAVLVQTLIYGVSKFFKWISAKNDKPQTPSAPLAPQA